MSKKNNLKTRKNGHQYALQREREAREKRERMLEKKKLQAESEKALASLSLGGSSAAAPAARAAPAAVQALRSVTTKKMKKKPIRLRKNAIIRGVRITDAASKKKVLELLAAEESMKESMMEGAEPLIAPKASKEKKMTLKKTKLKKKDKGTKLKKKAASVARE